MPRPRKPTDTELLDDLDLWADINSTHFCNAFQLYFAEDARTSLLKLSTAMRKLTGDKNASKKTRVRSSFLPPEEPPTQPDAAKRKGRVYTPGHKRSPR